MTTYHKVLLGLIAAAYFISPFDIIPDFFLPYLGWFDDTALVATILYYIKHGRLPDFLYKKRKSNFKSKSANFEYSGVNVKSSVRSDRSSKNRNGGGQSQPEQKNSAKQDTTYKNQNGECSSHRTKTEQNSSKRKEQESLEKQGHHKEIPKSLYQILGLLPGASKDDIQVAYRKAVKQYHPDKVAHLGKELQDFANKKFIEIKDAYNLLMKIS